jgi:hypothetical protein
MRSTVISHKPDSRGEVGNDKNLVLEEIKDMGSNLEEIKDMGTEQFVERISTCCLRSKGSAPLSFMAAVLAASFSTSSSYDRSSLTALLHVDVLILRLLTVAILETNQQQQLMDESEWTESCLRVVGLGTGKW